MSKICRIVDGQAVWLEKSEAYKFDLKPLKEIASTIAMGCTLHQVDELREDARKHGFTGVEFRPDPALIENGTPLYYDCYCTSPGQWERYIAHCGQKNESGVIGASQPTKDELERGREMILRGLDEKIERQG